MEILFATTNPAKLKIYQNKLDLGENILVTLKDLNITEDVEENGQTPLENAVIKAEFFENISSLPTIGMDDGLFFHNVPEEVQPKNNVRRVAGKRLTDEEMVTHYTSLVESYGNDGKLKGYFRRGVAVAYKNEVYTFEVDLPRVFSSTSSTTITEGFPLASIQFVPQFNKYKSELTDEEKNELENAEQEEVVKFLNESIRTITSIKKK